MGKESNAEPQLAADRLRSLVERLERLEEERKAVAGDIKDIQDRLFAVYAEAKSAGFDVRVMRRLVKERKMEPAIRQAFDALLDVYRRALGEYAATPLGEAAVEAVAARRGVRQ